LPVRPNKYDSIPAVGLAGLRTCPWPMQWPRRSVATSPLDLRSPVPGRGSRGGTCRQVARRAVGRAVQSPFPRGDCGLNNTLELPEVGTTEHQNRLDTAW